jgi:hypothetical protein
MEVRIEVLVLLSYIIMALDPSSFSLNLLSC